MVPTDSVLWPGILFTSTSTIYLEAAGISLKMVNIKTFVYCDLESTGLEKERPRITELSLVAVEPRHISKKPRVLNKLTLCFNPDGARFNDWVLKNTGLSPDNLSSQPRFSESTVRLLDAFLGSLPGPVCLVYVSIIYISM